MRNPAIALLTLVAFAQMTIIPDVAGVASASSGELLAAELPPGLTINTAPTPVLAQAVKSSITKRKDMAVQILRMAILSRAKKRGGGKTLVKDRSKGKSGWSGIDPQDVLELTKAAIEAAPELAQELINEAISLSPENADPLNGLINPGGTIPIRIPDLYGGIIPIPGGSQPINPGNSTGPVVIISPER